jgi:hypothetical protein
MMDKFVETKCLEIKWSVSKGRDTYGYNICTLWDGDKPYRTNGGGYDMVGTVFAHWLKENHGDKIAAQLLDKAADYYGLTVMGEKWYLAGACGFECMVIIAKAIELRVQCKYVDRKGLVHILIQE